MTSAALTLATVGLVVIFAGAARRLLGLRFGTLRTAAAGAIALGVAGPINRAILPAATAGSSGIDPLWFLVLATLAAVLTAMTFLVISEALFPIRSRGGVIAWRRRLRSRRRRTLRYLQIIRIAARHGLGPYLAGRSRADRAARRPTAVSSRARLARSIRRACDDGGVTFVKLGQTLAARRDLIALEFADELEQLHDQAAPARWVEIEQVIVAELGKPIDVVFAELDRAPIAAASIAQVHAGRLLSGEQVVVKVQRPGIADAVQRDLDIVERLASRLESSTRWGRSLGLGALARGFAAAVREELDFTVEARNMAAVAAQRESRSASVVRTPVAHPALSGRRVLVMERLPGESLASAQSQTASPDRQAVAAGLVDEILHQIMLDGVFHADPHPGNLMLLDDGSLGLIDFGSVGRLDATVRAGLRRFLLALDSGDPAAARDAMVELLVRPDDLDEQRLQQALGRFMARHLEQPPRAGLEMFTDLLRLVAEHGLAVPPDIAAVFRALITVDATLTRLSPGFDLVGHARSFAQCHVAGQVVRQLNPHSLVRELATLAPTLRQLPRRVDRVLDAAEQGRLRVNVRLLADARDRRFVTGALHQLLLTVLCATAGVMAVLLLDTRGGPSVTPMVSLHQLFGYNLLAVSAVLALRVMVPIFRRSHALDPE